MKAKKSLGQNFLRDENVVQEILGIAEVAAEDNVLEIGPGTGVLTEALAQAGAHVVAIELDHRLIDDLTKKFSQYENVSVIEGDILKVSIPDLVRNAFSGNKTDESASLSTHYSLPTTDYKVIANIPYYITAPIIRTLLSLSVPPQSLTLMVQDEVAERLAAEPGDMSLLSVMAQYYSDVEKKLFVPKESFDPVPQVDSAVIHIVPKRVYDKENDRKIFRLVRAGFAARRKTLANNLSTSLQVPRADVEKILETNALRKDIRAQALSIEDWERLQENF